MDKRDGQKTADRESFPRPPVKDLFLSFLRLGLTAFGGPAMVAYIGDLATKRKKWLDQPTFKGGVALCQSIPGATAIQAAGYVGLRARGLAGALASYIAFGLPAFLFMLVLSSLYAASRGFPWVSSLFHGLQVIVVAIVANATYAFGRGALKDYRDVFIVMTAASAFGLGVSPFLVIIGAGLAAIGLLHGRQRSEPPGSQAAGSYPPLPLYQILLICAAALAGVIFLYMIDGKQFDLAILMLKIDLFAFGGGFASIPLMLQEVVNNRGWMDSKTFMDGIALGQVTPGPIVITSTFVGYLISGLTGAVTATIAIFTPSFLILVISTTFFDKLQRSILFQRALRGILTSFVGLLVYVTIKFAIAVPWNIFKMLLCAAALAALLKKIDILYVVLAGALLSLILF